MKFVTCSRPRISFDYEVVPDSGAAVPVIGKDLVDKLGIPIDHKKKVKLAGASNESYKVEGSVKLHCTVKHTGRKLNIRFQVSSSLGSEMFIPIEILEEIKAVPTGFPFAICKITEEVRHEFKIIRDQVLTEFRDIMSDVLPATTIKTIPKDIIMKPGPCSPIQCTRARPVHYHLQESAYELIKGLLEAGIIVPETEVTEWISPSMFVPKHSGGCRLVTDYTRLNRFIERPVHPFMSAQDCLKQISPNAKVFATLDAVSGYFQVPLTEEASKLTTFLTMWGKFRYTRGPMGLKSSSDWWNQLSDQVTIDFQEWSVKIVDDILIWAENDKQLEERIRKIMQKCREHQITISASKFTIGEEVKFAGYMVSKDGIKPDPMKVAAIEHYPAPKDVSELRSFLGLAQQLGSFMPDLSQSTVKLRSLLKMNTEYIWSPEINEEFLKVKEILTSDMIVKPFDPELDTVLITDASRLNGLGYLLVQYDQENHPRLVQCGSFALTDHQKNYATIELEFLAIVRAIEKCSFYLMGMDRFKVYSDHRPLEGIMTKDLGDIGNARLVKWRQRIMQYSFDLHWVPGKKMLAADALSRHPTFAGYEEDDEVFFHLRSMQCDPRLAEMAKSGGKEYVETAKMITGNVPRNKVKPGHFAQQFSNIWHELSVLDTENGPLLCYGERVIPPPETRKKLLASFHETHQGISKTLSAVKEAFYWPALGNEVKQLLESCDACQDLVPSQQRESLHSYTEKLVLPMQLFSADIFEWAGHSYLAGIDGFSGMLFCEQLKQVSSQHVISALREMFYAPGFPERFRSDNGRQFVSEETTSFLKEHGTACETSSPEFPSSNGQAEAAVKIAKKLLRKCIAEGSRDTFKERLAELNRQPRADGTVPADRFNGRAVRGKHVRALPPVKPKTADKKKTGRDLKMFDVGDRVRVQNQKTKVWDKQAHVVSIHEEGRSYVLQLDDGRIFRRNRRFLRPLGSAPDDKDIPEAPVSPEPPVPPRRSKRLEEKNRSPVLSRLTSLRIDNADQRWAPSSARNPPAVTSLKSATSTRPTLSSPRNRSSARSGGSTSSTTCRREEAPRSSTTVTGRPSTSTISRKSTAGSQASASPWRSSSPPSPSSSTSRSGCQQPEPSGSIGTTKPSTRRPLVRKDAASEPLSSRSRRAAPPKPSPRFTREGTKPESTWDAPRSAKSVRLPVIRAGKQGHPVPGMTRQ